LHLALSHLYAMNFLHRDVKPENILIAQDDNIKLSDFGLIAPKAEDGCIENNMCGTPDYFAPEVFTERRVSTSIDFWALVVSVILAKMQRNEYGPVFLPEKIPSLPANTPPLLIPKTLNLKPVVLLFPHKPPNLKRKRNASSSSESTFEQAKQNLAAVFK
ncbi:hypothetical protein B4U79_14047, partial [Dinothrombium tinctorium]